MVWLLAIRNDQSEVCGHCLSPLHIDNLLRSQRIGQRRLFKANNPTPGVFENPMIVVPGFELISGHVLFKNHALRVSFKQETVRLSRFVWLRRKKSESRWIAFDSDLMWKSEK